MSRDIFKEARDILNNMEKQDFINALSLINAKPVQGYGKPFPTFSEAMDQSSIKSLKIIGSVITNKIEYPKKEIKIKVVEIKTECINELIPSKWEIPKQSNCLASGI